MREDDERDRKTLLTPDGRGKADKVIALDRLLTAARRAGAEEMRERCEVACNDLAEREDERYLRAVNNATREDANMRAAAFRAAVRELRALHPDAKGGDHA